MSSPRSHISDAFVNDSYNIPFNNAHHFPQSEHTFSTSIFSAIASASHDTLFRSGNAAYTSLSALHLQAKYELQAQRNLVMQLQGVIDKLTSQRPTPGSAHDQENSDNLIVPDKLEPGQLDKKDYPDVPYWREGSWIEHIEGQRERGQNPSRLGFLTDDDGIPVTELRIKEFMLTAKQAWNELYRLRLDPSSWTKKTPKAASYLAYILKKNFSEFRYCDGDWKAERFAIVKYPDWCRDARESGRLTRARPSKRKTGDHELPKDERRRKKAKAKSTVPLGTQVIDLANDVPVSSSTSCTVAVTNSTTGSTPIIAAHNPLPTLTILESSPRQESSTLTAALSATRPTPTTHVSNYPSSHPSQVATPAIPQLPAHSDTIFSNAAVLDSNLSVSDPGSEKLADSVPPTVAPTHEHEQQSATLAIVLSSNPSASDPVGPEISADNVPPAHEHGRQSRARRRVNPLAALSIPKPSIQVPSSESESLAATMPFSGAELTTRNAKSGGKLMVASSTVLSARNLFAIDYLKEHSPTTAEFKQVWDSLSVETKKKYEAFSRERKSATRLAAMTAVNANTVCDEGAGKVGAGRVPMDSDRIG